MRKHGHLSQYGEVIHFGSHWWFATMPAALIRLTLYRENLTLAWHDPDHIAPTLSNPNGV
jgi:hypothetical protein